MTYSSSRSLKTILSHCDCMLLLLTFCILFCFRHYQQHWIFSSSFNQMYVITGTTHHMTQLLSGLAVNTVAMTVQQTLTMYSVSAEQLSSQSMTFAVLLLVPPKWQLLKFVSPLPVKWKQFDLAVSADCTCSSPPGVTTNVNIHLTERHHETKAQSHSVHLTHTPHTNPLCNP